MMAFRRQTMDPELAELLARQELADELHEAAADLNRAIRKAHVAGLHVEVTAAKRHRLVEYPRVEVTVSVPLRPTDPEVGSQ